MVPRSFMSSLTRLTAHSVSVYKMSVQYIIAPDGSDKEVLVSTPDESRFLDVSLFQHLFVSLSLLTSKPITQQLVKYPFDDNNTPFAPLPNSDMASVRLFLGSWALRKTSLDRVSEFLDFARPVDCDGNGVYALSRSTWVEQLGSVQGEVVYAHVQKSKWGRVSLTSLRTSHIIVLTLTSD